MKQTLALFVLLAGFACSSTENLPDAADSADLVAPPAQAVLLVRVEGDLATTTTGGAPVTLSILGMSDEPAPAAGAAVHFRILDGQGQTSATDAALSSEETILDDTGAGSVTLTPGDVAGMLLVEASDEARLARPLLYRVFVAPASSATVKPLHVLAINDFHMRLEPRRYQDRMVGGLARIAHIFQTVRDNNDALDVGTVIVNAGDDYENTLFHNLDGAIPELYRLYDRMGVDVTVIGNHDYHFGMTYANQLVAAAEPDFSGPRQGHPMHFVMGSVDPSTLAEPYQVLASQFETEFGNDDNSARFNQTLLYDVAGIKVGILGVVTDAAVFTQVAGNPSLYQMVGAPLDYAEKLTFFDPDPRHAPYINSGLDALADDGADVILVASHAGLGYQDRVNIPPGKDEFIAKFGQGQGSGRSADVVISGHSHVQLNHAIPVTNPAGTTTWIGQAREAGEFVASWMLLVDTETDQVSLVDYHLLEVDDGLPADPEVEEAVAKLAARIPTELNVEPTTPVGEIGIDLSHRSRAPAGLGRLIASAFLTRAPAEADLDAALVIPSIYRADLWTGPVTSSDVYDVVPLHELDNQAVNDERLVIWETRAGRYNCSIFGIESTKLDDITIAEYILEAIHSIGEVLEGISPGMGKELNLEVMQFAGLTYQVDRHGEAFHKVVPGSVRIGGEPVDDARTYRLAMVHSIGVNLAYVINFIVTAKDVETNETRSALVLQDEEKPYAELDKPAWQFFHDELTAVLPGAPDGIPEQVWMTGDDLRSVEPDLACNPMDIVVDTPAVRGTTVPVTVTVRNYGDAPVASATASLYFESTPWDRTDDDDGRSELEGMGADFVGSLVKIGTEQVAVPAWPETAKVTFDWAVPAHLPPYAYPLVVRIAPADGEVELGNNAGPDQRRRVEVTL